MIKKNRNYGNNYGQQFNENEELKVTQSSGNGVYTDIDGDAWGRTKSITDFSLFHGLFTYNIPSQIWLMFENGTEVSTSTRITSSAGHGSIKSGAITGNSGFLRSKRHPRYQPNRGHLFSTAGFLPNTSTGIRKLGLLNTVTGVYFELSGGKLYAVVYDKSSEKVKEEIGLSQIGLTVSDLQYGTLYDIQYQWRGVGEYFFYINQKLVYKTSFLGNTTELTLANPALSAGFYSENTDGTEVEIKIGCCDITTEGGQKEGATYVSISNSIVKLVNTANYPVLVAHVKETLNGLPNTRDVLALRATGSSDQKSYMKAYITRNASAITGAIYSDAQQGSGLEFDTSATAINTSLCQLLWSKRINIDDSAIVDLPSDLIDFILSEGDYLIITMERENPTQVANVVCSLEMGEEI